MSMQVGTLLFEGGAHFKEITRCPGDAAKMRGSGAVAFLATVLFGGIHQGRYHGCGMNTDAA